MIKIEITSDLRGQIARAKQSLSQNGPLSDAAMVADKIAEFYYAALIEKFCETAGELYANHDRALIAARNCDAVLDMVAIRSNQIHSLKGALPTSEKAAILNRIFDNALAGNLNLLAN